MVADPQLVQPNRRVERTIDGHPERRSVSLQQADVTLCRRDNPALASARYLAEVFGDWFASSAVLPDPHFHGGTITYMWPI